MSKPKGFSLIELLVVIAIIGLLSTMAVVSLNNARVKARDTRRMGDIKAIQTAIEMYKTQQTTDVVPNGANWAAVGTQLASYMTALPSDPNNSGVYSYVYCRNATADSKYLIGAILEQNMAIQGDLDTLPGLTGTPTCVQSGSGTITAWASMSCADSNGGNLTGASQTAFCLGQS